MRKPKPLGQKTIKICVERGKQGLYYGTSPDLKGLLIAEETSEQVWQKVPETIAAMYHASGVEFVNITDLRNNTWLARPEPIYSVPITNK